MHRFVEFNPDLGGDQRLYQRILKYAVVDREGLREALLGFANQAHDPKAQFAISVLNDILAAGGTVLVRDSRLFVAWPEWSGESGRKNARQALETARGTADVSPVEARRVAPLFAGTLDGTELAQVVKEGRFRLRAASEVHPSGVPYADAFSMALRYWSMPYRGRTGRTRRYVLTVEHALLPSPCVAGILELGDEAPFCNWRDELIGLSDHAMWRWLSEDPVRNASSGAERLRAIRSALRSFPSGEDLSEQTATDVLGRSQELENLAKGRSRVRLGEEGELKIRKRATYALRLASGEVGLRRLQSGNHVDANTRRLISRGLRALHDLLVPRFHMEVSVCGALPPFSDALVGKLLVAHFAHPDTVAAVMTPLGDLVAWAFEPTKLESHLKSTGMLAITTKGLYAHHAPLYQGSIVPGRESPLKLRRIAMTKGNTTTLMSNQTARFARDVLAHSDGDPFSVRVSQVYGSGGAKRHRAIEAASLAANVNKDLVNAGIERPVYGTSFVSNAAAVSWEGATPHWLIPRHLDSDAYSDHATSIWRQKWGDRAVSRVEDYAYFRPFLDLLVSNEQRNQGG